MGSLHRAHPRAPTLALLAVLLVLLSGGPRALARAAGVQAGGEALERLLSLDRFHFYLGEWARYQMREGRMDLARAVQGWSPEAISRLEMAMPELSNPKINHYTAIGIVITIKNQGA